MNLNGGAGESVQYDVNAAKWRFQVSVAATTDRARIRQCWEYLNESRHEA